MKYILEVNPRNCRSVGEGKGHYLTFNLSSRGEAGKIQ